MHTPKRFWESATVVETAGGFGVMLDRLVLKTPRKRLLELPKPELAQCVAAEWQAVEQKINKAAMPYTRFAEAVIDAAADERTAIIGKLALYGGNDLICYRADAPEELVERQNAGWDPLLEWVETAIGAPLRKTCGIVHVAQPESSLAKLTETVREFDSIRLTALYDLVTLSGSLVIGLAVANGALGSAEAWAISRIDEQWQIDQWGIDDEATAMEAPKRAAFDVAAHVLRLCPVQTMS